MVTTNLSAAGIALMAATAVFAQAPGSRPAFDVASVKASDPAAARGGGGHFAFGMGGTGGNIQVAPASLTMRNVTLKNAIRWAYHITEYQVSGPEWLDSARYNINAKSAGPATEDQLQLMMQTLLADRFKLAAHQQTKEFQVFVLAPGKNGTKLQESKSEGESVILPQPNSMTVTIQRAAISQMIEMMTPLLGAPVIDETGLRGRYDITANLAKYASEMQPGAGGAPPDPLSLISSALEGELGLKLEKRKMPLEQLVVDHIEKAPTEN
jgi:uncharacterized protein (TIGR03435 family)